MTWRLLPHLSACIASDQIILLDVRQDRYFAVPEAIVPEVRAWLESAEPSAPPIAFATLLQDTGVIRAGDPKIDGATQSAIAIPSAAPISATKRARLSAGDRLQLGSSLIGTWFSLRFRPLHSVLARSARRKTVAPADPHLLEARTAAYLRARKLLPFPRNCLLDSLALDRWLGANGSGRSLVMGVAVHPFAAHCWLQSDDRVLNDSYDRVSRYTPILVA